MSKRRRGSTRIPKPRATLGHVAGVSFCMRCLERVDLTAFRDARIAGRYPIVHTCGRVLMAEPR
jgi:hypothetical protein